MPDPVSDPTLEVSYLKPLPKPDPSPDPEVADLTSILDPIFEVSDLMPLPMPDPVLIPLPTPEPDRELDRLELDRTPDWSFPKAES